MTYDVAYSVDTGSADNPYVVRYNQIVYNYGGKTKLKTIAPEQKISGVYFSGIVLSHSTTSNNLTEITNELLSKNIENVFSETDYQAMFAHINNLVYSKRITHVVDNSVLDNPGMTDDIWPLGVDYRDYIPTGGEVVSVNRGWTYIRGQTYNVSSDDSKLVPLSGGASYDINSLDSNKYDAVNVIQVLVPTTTSYVVGYVSKVLSGEL